LLSGPPGRGSSPRRFAAIALGALVLVGAVAALIVATSGSGTRAKPLTGRTTNAPQTPTTRRAPVFNPATVTVAVLNGTATNQLAHHIAQRLMAKGYREGKVATASDQTHTSTIVAYLPGHRSAAVHVATALGLGPASVQPVDTSTQQVACPSGGTCPADVVVTVGADLANS
jgi:hypothetical protein